MAANTTLLFSLQARDWEIVISIYHGTLEDHLQRLEVNLVNYYAANGNPQGNTVIQQTVKEKSLVKIFEMFYGNTVFNLYKDQGASPFKRVIEAIRAAALTTGDSYLTDELAAIDAKIDAAQTTLKKSGRRYLMMEDYDNN